MKIWMKIFTVLLVVGIIAAFLIYKLIYNKPHPDYERTDADYALTVTSMYQEFIDNKADAGKKYNGKVIAISGKLSKVETTDSLTICVFVLNQGLYGDEGVRCTMSKNFSEQAKKFQPDGEVKLKGLCTGFNDTDVILDKCSIVQQ